MLLQEYLHKHPLTRDTYTRADVEKIRKDAFKKGSPAFRMTRSEKQNGYYWKVVLRIMADDTGHTRKEIHEWMGLQFLVMLENGQEVVESTTRLSTVEFETYLQKVRMFASTELGIFIPLPNETEFAYTIKEKVNGKHHRSGVPSPEKQDSDS